MGYSPNESLIIVIELNRAWYYPNEVVKYSQSPRRFSRTISLTVALLLSSSFPSFASDTKDQKPVPPPPKIVQTATASGDAFGGEGGGPNSLRCPSNYVMTGISDSDYVAATDWYNVGLAITCTAVALNSSNSLYLTSSSSKTPVFVFGSFVANKESNCGPGSAISDVRVYANSTGFVQDVGANCKTFPSQSTSVEIPAANSPSWDYITPGLSSCAAGSFATGVFGRNGEGIDKLGIYCSSFSVEVPKIATFESYLQNDLVLTSNPNFIRYGEYYICNSGAYGYRSARMIDPPIEKVTLESATFILRSNDKIIGAASSDDFKLLPKWIFGIDESVPIAKVLNSTALWTIPGTASAKVTCDIAGYKENQILYSQLR